MSAALNAKALRYVQDRRVRIETTNPGFVDALVYGGQPTPYAVMFVAGRWTCTCPARVTHCVHIAATQLVLRAADEGLDVNRAPDLREQTL